MDNANMGTSPTSPPQEPIIPMSKMREVIARRMTESFQSVPHFGLIVDVNMNQLQAFRKTLVRSVEEATGKRMTYTDLLIKIVATVLSKHPEINASYTPKGIQQHAGVNIGLAIAIEGGLMVPVIRGADKKSIAEITTIRSDLVKRAARRLIPPEEMIGGSMTLTNMGMYGMKQMNPIINPPESCILAVGAMEDRPIAVDGAVVVQPMMTLALAIDHRLLDGATGAGFLGDIKGLIENPNGLE
jgi:pyruvate dehydrogenase E2 component (dihydrolipoamide acetyltransferase)